MIFKLQRPLATNTKPTVLFYNKDRTIEGMTELSQGLLTLFGGEFKIYVRGRLIKNTLTIDEVVDEQAW